MSQIGEMHFPRSSQRRHTDWDTVVHFSFMHGVKAVALALQCPLPQLLHNALRMHIGHREAAGKEGPSITSCLTFYTTRRLVPFQTHKQSVFAIVEPETPARQ